MPRPSFVGPVAKAVIWIGVTAGLLVLLVLVWPFPEEGPTPRSSTETTGSWEQVSLKVDGMTCPT